MIQNVLHHIGGISAYGVISICIFFAVFIGAMIWAGSWKMRQPSDSAIS